VSPGTGSWLLLRGLGRDSRHWGDFPERLSRRIGAPMHGIDLPGNGALYQRRSPARVDALVEACRTQAIASLLPPPYRVVAISLGGMLAVDWAIRHPGEIDHAVLINTSLRPHAPWHRRLQPRHLRALITALCADDPTRWERLIMALTSNVWPSDRPRSAALLQQWIDWHRQCPPTRGNLLRQLIAASRFAAPERPDCPLLLLGSAADRLVSVECSRRLAAAWPVPYREHPTAGHDLPLDDPDWLIDAIVDWISSTADRFA